MQGSNPFVWSQRTVLCVAVGMALGVVGSYIVNTSLAEVSYNPTFSAAFGVCFIGLGGVIMWRVLVPDADMPQEDPVLRRCMVLFGLMVMAAGFFSFFLDKVWFRSLSTGAKIPMYTILGASVTYAICFSLADLLNQGVPWCKCCHGGEEAVTPIVSTPMQVWSLMAVGLISGACYGYLFGMIDVEDDDEFNDRFREQEMVCVPLGIILGGVAGFTNDRFRHIEDVMFSAVPTRCDWDFDDRAFEDDEERVHHCTTLME